MAHKFFINEVDASEMGLMFRDGTYRELNKLPKAKQTLQRSWADQHGTEVDTAAVFFETRTLTLPMLLSGSDELDYLQKLADLNDFFLTPGYFTLGAEGINRLLTLRYVEVTDWQDLDFCASFNLILADDFPQTITPLV